MKNLIACILTNFIVSAWRHRLPNDYEELALWDEVFTWRSHMFSAITSNFAWSEPSTLATLHDRPWTAIRMSVTARKQGMRQVSAHGAYRNVVIPIWSLT